MVLRQSSQISEQGNLRQAEPDTISALGTVPWRVAAHPGELGISKTSEAPVPGGGRWFLNGESLIFWKESKCSQEHYVT